MTCFCRLLACAWFAGSLGCGRFGFDTTSADADAGIADATSTVDAGDPDALIAASGCGESDSLLCDGFETDLTAWTIDDTGGAFELVSTPAFRGDAALRVTTVTQGAFIQATRPHDVITSGTMYFRAYYNLPSSLVTSGLIAVTSSGLGNGIHHHFSFDGNTPIIMVNEVPSAAADPVPRDTWFCVEIDVTIGAVGAVAMRIDGVPVVEVNNVNTAVPNGYGAFELIVFYEDQNTVGGYEYFIDEVAVGDRPIGCQ